jgi:hypothetical protein
MRDIVKLIQCRVRWIYFDQELRLTRIIPTLRYQLFGDETHQELLGQVDRTDSRTFTKLERDGLIQIMLGSIRLLDAPRMKGPDRSLRKCRWGLVFAIV